MPGLRDKKKQRRRERILDVALGAFNSKGFVHTTMQEIAADADLAVGTLYNYFPSKNDLLMGIMDRKMEEIRNIGPREIVSAFRQENDGAAIIKRIVLTLVRQSLVLTRSNWHEVFAALFSSRMDLQRAIAMDIETIGLLERLLHNLKKRGLVRSDAPLETMAMGLYSLIGFQFMKYVFVTGTTEDDLLEGISQQIELLFAGIGTGRKRTGG